MSAQVDVVALLRANLRSAEGVGAIIPAVEQLIDEHRRLQDAADVAMIGIAQALCWFVDQREREIKIPAHAITYEKLTSAHAALVACGVEE